MKTFFNLKFVICRCIITALLGLMIVGTIYDVAIYQKQRKMEKIKERLENNNTNLANGKEQFYLLLIYYR